MRRGVFMSELQTNYINNKDSRGTISYATDVIAIIAGLAATEIEGVAGMSGGITSGIAEMLGKRNLTKGVKAQIGTEEAAIDISIIVEYGVAIHEVAKKIQENVKKAVENMTGLRVVSVNIIVQGVNIPTEPKQQPANKLR